ncbi:hypothetical protein [uncultured Methylovirgula sp.]|uniref:hypothetical protein n=1 Tax=uncultured Methylovirgula sp. TaxID=1285960 RepID=UPI002619D59C|nr:hypothetical protein [uncultured Methylovirgula sp.]
MTIIKGPQASLCPRTESSCGDSARAMSLLFLLRRWRAKNAGLAAAPRAKPEDAPSSNTALASLVGGDLAERFHAWLGRSGRRYICSVFPVDRRDSEGGLPDFAEAIVIAVKADAAGQRRVVGFCQCEHGAGPVARHAFVSAAIAAGAQQWHVHLLTADPQKRRAAIEDIEALCQPTRGLVPA